MKKLGLLLVAAVLVFGFSSCDTAQQLTEAEALEVVEVLSNATTDSLYSQDVSRMTGDELAKAVSASFTATQTGGGTAVFNYLADANSDAGAGLADAVAYFDVTFTDFTVDAANDDGTTTEYTLNGTMYMEWDMEISYDAAAASFVWEYVYLLYTDSTDTLSVAGGVINTTLDINVENVLTMTSANGSLTVSYTINGTCNGYTFDDENGTMTVSY